MASVKYVLTENGDYKRVDPKPKIVAETLDQAFRRQLAEILNIRLPEPP